jgi:hypothetical protein
MEKAIFHRDSLREIYSFKAPEQIEHFNPNVLRMLPIWQMDVMTEWLYVKLGRPRWLIDRQMLELLDTCKVDADLSGVVFTHDVLTLVFEEGVKINGIPLEWIRVCAVKSKMAEKAIRDFFPKDCINERAFSAINFTVCFRGYHKEDGKISLDPRTWHKQPRLGYEEGRMWREYGSEKYISDPDRWDFDNETLTRESFRAFMFKAAKVAAAAMVYQHARPDLVTPFTLPRSERYKQHGERENISLIRLPRKLGGAKKIISSPPVEGASGKIMSPHYRGYVLAVLRDERFKRKPDGSFNTVLRSPCAIHPELMEDAT